MAAPEWVPPNEFNEYRLVRRLGHGSMGQVWLAVDTVLDRRVAIKFLAELHDDVQTRERFLVEARAIARLSHPNVVSIHRVGTIDGQPYAVTELIEGDSLDKVEKPLRSERALAIGIELARGLAAAHRAGILHRDLKPANAMLGPEGAKLLDFGLAKLAQRHAPAVLENAPAIAPTFGKHAADPEDPEATLRPLRAEGHSPADDRPDSSPAITEVGAVLGTPFYLAPECWRGEPATRRSDVYSFGALIYELCAGAPPSRYLPEGRLSDVVTQFDVRPLSEVAPHIEGRLATIVVRCLSRVPAARYGSGDELREALEQLQHGPSASLPVGDPYRGLLPFEAEHRALFFGRSADIRSVVERLRSRGLVVVAGESGVGKSSLCRAGVLPAVTEGALGGGRSWRCIPCLPGRHPLRSITAACAPMLEVSEENLYRDLRQDPGGLARRLLHKLGSSQGVLLFVDQLEEWVSIADPEEAELAARALFELCSGAPGLRALATSRSDLLPDLTRLPMLGSELSTSLYLLGPIQREHLRELIEGPARAHGVRFESDTMVQHLVDFAAQGGALPLLQFALSRLWEGRGGQATLTEQALQAMGGVSGALAQHADGVISRLPADQAADVKSLLLSLVSSHDTRRRRAEAELLGTPASLSRKGALATLARERILFARDSADGKGWEIAHEALLREWPTLQRWMSEDAEARVARERLQSAARDWERLGRVADSLWGAPQLKDVPRPVFQEATGLDREFLLASRRRLRARRLLVPSVAGAVLLAGAVTFVAQTWAQTRALDRRVRTHLQLAERHFEVVDRDRGAWEALRDEATGTFDRGDWPEGEKRWEKALAHRESWLAAVGLAGVEVERAFLLAPERPEVRRQLAKVVAARLVFARLEGRPGAVAAEQERLRSLDDAGELLAALDRPGTVHVQLSPPHAAIELRRMQPEAGRQVLTEAIAFQNGRALAAGSYVLTASAPGHVAVRAPFILAPGEELPLGLVLLPEAQVPEGFVSIPTGRFLFGGAGDEKVRREFYEAAPLHPMQLDAFLVGRHEVTFDDWLGFVEALPPRLRNAHLPNTYSTIGNVADAAFQRLVATPDGWSFTFAPVSQRYVATNGRIEYRDRDVRAVQRWRQLPVTAISPRDMEAYVQWLDASGKVPGARLCTEHEWERVARGADARTFPHGDVFEPDDANLDETYGFRDAAYGPDEVGSHPASDSPFGVRDLIGNAGEVVRSVNTAKQFVVRGGSWHVGQISSRIPNSWVANADFRQVDVGFRVCASLP